MHLSRPYTAIASGLEGQILVLLAGTTRRLTGRDVARLIPGRSTEGVRMALHRLTEHGIVLQEQAGRSILFTLNRHHLAAPIVDRLAALRSDLIAFMKATIKTWEPPATHASLFGSTARGDGDTSSDIDVFIVRPRRVDEEELHWRSQVDAWARSVERATGNRVSLAEVSETELKGLRRRQPAIVSELLKDAIPLSGRQIANLLRSER